MKCVLFIITYSYISFKVTAPGITKISRKNVALNLSIKLRANLYPALATNVTMIILWPDITYYTIQILINRGHYHKK